MKNRVIIYTTGLVTLIFWLFVTSCSTSVDEDISDKNGFQFCVQIPKALEVETKASLGGGDEKLILKMHGSFNMLLPVTICFIVFI